MSKLPARPYILTLDAPEFAPEPIVREYGTDAEARAAAEGAAQHPVTRSATVTNPRTGFVVFATHFSNRETVAA